MPSTPQRTKKTQEKKPARVLVLIHDHALLPRIDAYAVESRRHSRSNAIEVLVAEALDARDKARA